MRSKSQRSLRPMKMGFHQRMLCITLALLISLFMLPAGAVSAEESEA